MKNIYRIIIYILAAAILFGAGFFTGHETAQTAAPEQSAYAAKNAATLSAVVSINDGTHVLKGKITLSKDETAFSLLQKFTNKQHIEMDSSGSGKMVYVTSLNNKKASKNTGWLFTVNGKQPNVGAGAVKVKKNDQVVWHYSKF